MVCRYCVLLITGEEQTFLPGNKAFLDFASANKKEVLRFAYVYQHQQQPLCQALLHDQASLTPQVSHRNTHSAHTYNQLFFTHKPCSIIDFFKSPFSICIEDSVHLLSNTFLPRANRNGDCVRQALNGPNLICFILQICCKASIYSTSAP